MSNVVVYIYDHQWNIRTQIFDVTNFECTQNINAYDTASFQIQYNHDENTEINLKAYNEVKIVEVTDSGELVYIHWVIDSVEAWLVNTVVYVRSFEWLFEHKIIDTDKNYSAQTLDAVMTDLLANVNGRYDTGLTLDCGVADTIDLTVKKWSTLASVLKEIVGLWYQYRVLEKVVIVKEIVWSDKTAWVNFVELRWDINDPQDRNVSDAQIKLDWWQMINAPFHTTGGFSTDATSIWNFGRIEQVVSSDGTPAQALADALEKHKDLIKVIDVTPSVDDFFFADIWDKVKLYIDAGNDIMQFDWSVNVIQKLIDTRWVVRIQVSSTTVKALTFLETVKENQKEIQKLKT